MKSSVVYYVKLMKYKRKENNLKRDVLIWLTIYGLSVVLICLQIITITNDD